MRFLLTFRTKSHSLTEAAVDAASDDDAVEKAWDRHPALRPCELVQIKAAPLLAA